MLLLKPLEVRSCLVHLKHQPRSICVSLEVQAQAHLTGFTLLFPPPNTQASFSSQFRGHFQQAAILDAPPRPLPPALAGLAATAAVLLGAKPCELPFPLGCNFLVTRGCPPVGQELVRAGTLFCSLLIPQHIAQCLTHLILA